MQEYGFLYPWPFLKVGPSPMSHLHCSFKNLLFAAPLRYAYIHTCLRRMVFGHRMSHPGFTRWLKPRPLYGRITVLSVKPVKEGKSRAWICFFIWIEIGFLSGFWFEIELFRCHYWKWIKRRKWCIFNSDKKANLVHDWKNAPKIHFPQAG